MLSELSLKLGAYLEFIFIINASRKCKSARFLPSIVVSTATLMCWHEFSICVSTLACRGSNNFENWAANVKKILWKIKGMKHGVQERFTNGAGKVQKQPRTFVRHFLLNESRQRNCRLIHLRRDILNGAVPCMSRGCHRRWER